jgi:hypothetical protein
MALILKKGLKERWWVGFIIICEECLAEIKIMEEDTPEIRQQRLRKGYSSSRLCAVLPCPHCGEDIYAFKPETRYEWEKTTYPYIAEGVDSIATRKKALPEKYIVSEGR